MKIKNIILIFLVGVLVIISTQNTQEVTIKLIFWDITISFIILIYVIFAISFVIGVMYSNIKRASKIRTEKKKQKLIEKENKKKLNSKKETP